MADDMWIEHDGVDSQETIWEGNYDDDDINNNFDNVILADQQFYRAASQPYGSEVASNNGEEEDEENSSQSQPVDVEPEALIDFYEEVIIATVGNTLRRQTHRNWVLIYIAEFVNI